MKKALVIGVSGQDGSYLADFLLRKGYDVIGTSRDHENSSFDNLTRLGIKDRVTLTSMCSFDFHSVVAVINKYKPDEIYNLSGQTSVGSSFQYPFDTFESILTGTICLLECIRLLDYPVRFFNAGSSEVFGETLKPAKENSQFNPRSPYAIAKAASCYAVSNYREAYALNLSNGILFNHESPFRPKRFLTKKVVDSVKRIVNGSDERLSLGNIDIVRDWGWAPDYVEAMWLMLNADVPDDYIIATGTSHTLKEFLDQCFSFYNLNWENYVDVDPLLFRPTDILVSTGDPSKIGKKLGWHASTNLAQLIENLLTSD